MRTTQHKLDGFNEATPFFQIEKLVLKAGCKDPLSRALSSFEGYRWTVFSTSGEPVALVTGKQVTLL